MPPPPPISSLSIPVHVILSSSPHLSADERTKIYQRQAGAESAPEGAAHEQASRENKGTLARHRIINTVSCLFIYC